MDIEQFNYLWTTQQDRYVLLKLRFGYSVFDQENRNGVAFDSEEQEEVVIAKCLEQGNKVVEPRSLYVK